MSKPYKLHVAVAASKANLPIPIYLQREAAEETYSAWLRAKEASELCKPRLGRPRTKDRYRKPVLVEGQSTQEVDQKMAMLNEVLGLKARGNKRHGNPKLYRDLLEVFVRLRSKGITLPKGANLSTKAVKGGVGQVLKDHSYTSQTVDELASDFQERRRVGRVMKTVFTRVAGVVDSNPSPRA